MTAHASSTQRKRNSVITLMTMNWLMLAARLFRPSRRYSYAHPAQSSIQSCLWRLCNGGDKCGDTEWGEADAMIGGPSTHCILTGRSPFVHLRSILGRGPQGNKTIILFLAWIWKFDTLRRSHLGSLYAVLLLTLSSSCTWTTLGSWAFL